MDDITNFVQDSYHDDGAQPAAPDKSAAEAEQSAPELAQVQKILKQIKSDKAFHKDAFGQMRRDMFVAKYGRIPEYPKQHYKVALAGRHVKAKTAALYAKNPKVVAKRREQLDFVVWDENPQSLQMAMKTIQTAQQMMQQAQPTVDPATGVASMPELPQGFDEALATANELLQDFQQGMQRRTLMQKVGKSLEILVAQAFREQKPLDFKTAAKQMVRRTCTTGVGYIELGFQRAYGPRPAMTEKLADFRARLDHLQMLATKVEDAENPIRPDDPEIFELQKAIEAMANEKEVLLREGLIIDFPQATKVIPDQLCRKLVGFIGARHITLEYLFTCDQVKELFKVDIGKNYVGYKVDGKSDSEASSVNTVPDDNDDGDAKVAEPVGKGSGLVCVYKHYDKVSGLVYYVVEGYDKFLKDPAGPDVFVEDFWPVYALTFNDVEDEAGLFPPSDVFLMLDQNMEYNRARQGMREHRKAARPRFAYANGQIQEADLAKLKTLDPFEIVAIDLPEGQSIEDVMKPIPIAGVDPNLYGTEQYMTDTQMAVGSSESRFGGTSKSTATESAIAANSSASDDGSSIDDLDGFLTMVARSIGQILLREMSEEQVKIVVGPGAVWPHLTLGEIASELFLEVEAGSTGKPNQAVELNNFKTLAPFLLQTPGISPTWVAKTMVRRLDDSADLTEALSEGALSIIAQNGMAQVSTGNPATDPNAQGGEGKNNAPAPTEKQPGSDPAFGSNQV
jgi:hypothetical protein